MPDQVFMDSHSHCRAAGEAKTFSAPAELAPVPDPECRLKEQHGPLSSGVLYLLYFLPTSVNTAWLSVASGLGALLVPASYGVQENMDAYSVALAVVVTCAGRRIGAGMSTRPSCFVCLLASFWGHRHVVCTSTGNLLELAVSHITLVHLHLQMPC